MTIPIVEIFCSIEGEGVRSGLVCTFIRVAGCNLRCSYCDTTYSYDETKATQMTVDDIIEKVKFLDCPTVTITGGEPLINREVVDVLIRRLLDEGYYVNIETNGSVDINVVRRQIKDNLIFTIDWKSLSSKMSEKMLSVNFKNALYSDVFKFVVGDKNDLIEMARILKEYPTLARIYVSPVFGKIEPREIVEFLKLNKLHDITLQLQLHKIIWPVDMRGV